MSRDYREISILLVEDDDIDAQAVVRGFRKLKLANPVFRAKNGIEAFEVLRNEGKDKHSIMRPYVVLLDLNMPVMGGLEFLHAIRDDEELNDTIVFVLTTSDDDEDRVAAYHENVSGYIVKSDIKEGFTKVIDMLDHYWRVVLLPV